MPRIIWPGWQGTQVPGTDPGLHSLVAADRWLSEISELSPELTHGGAGLDLMIPWGRKKFGFEIKRTTQPQITPSMRSALSDLKLERLDVIHAGSATFDLSKKIRAVSWKRLLEDIPPLR